MCDALQPTVFILGVFRAQANRLRMLFLLGHALWRERPQRLQQPVARLRDEADSRRDGDIGEDVCGVLEAQSVLDQPQSGGRADQGIENLSQPWGCQTL